MYNLHILCLLFGASPCKDVSLFYQKTTLLTVSCTQAFAHGVPAVWNVLYPVLFCFFPYTHSFFSLKTKSYSSFRTT